MRHADFVEVERGEHDQQRQQWQRDNPIGEAHQQPVGPAAEIAGKKPDCGPDRRRGERRRNADRQRHAAAFEQPQQRVAAKLVGAERVRGRRSGEAVQQIDRGRIGAQNVRDQGSRGRCRGDRHQQQKRQPHR